MFKKISALIEAIKDKKWEIVFVISVIVLVSVGVYYWFYVMQDSRDCARICNLNGSQPALISHRFGCVCSDGNVFN